MRRWGHSLQGWDPEIRGGGPRAAPWGVWVQEGFLFPVKGWLPPLVGACDLTSLFVVSRPSSHPNTCNNLPFCSP